MMTERKGQRPLRAFVLGLLLVALFIQTACISDTFSKDESSAKQAEAESAVEALRDERFPGAEIQNVYAVKVTDYGHYYLTDLAQAELVIEGEKLPIWLNLKTGELFLGGAGGSDEGMNVEAALEEASQEAVRLYLEARGVDESKILASELDASLLIPTGLETGDLRLDYLPIRGLPDGCREAKALPSNHSDGILFAVLGNLELDSSTSVKAWASLDAVRTMRKELELSEWNLTVTTLDEGLEIETLFFDGENVSCQVYGMLETDGLILHYPLEKTAEFPLNDGVKREYQSAAEAAENIAVTVTEDEIEVVFDADSIEYVKVYAMKDSPLTQKRYCLEPEENKVTLEWRELESRFVLVQAGETMGYYFSDSFTLKAE